MILGVLVIALLLVFLAPKLVGAAFELAGSLCALLFAFAGLFIWGVIALAVVVVAFRIVFG